MAVKIRLMRVGKKKQPTYRVVVADGRSPCDGRFIEIIGQYAPREEPSGVEINAESALAWLRKGAQFMKSKTGFGYLLTSRGWIKPRQ